MEKFQLLLSTLYSNGGYLIGEARVHSLMYFMFLYFKKSVTDFTLFEEPGVFSSELRDYIQYMKTLGVGNECEVGTVSKEYYIAINSIGRKLVQPTEKTKEYRQVKKLLSRINAITNLKSFPDTLNETSGPLELAASAHLNLKYDGKPITVDTVKSQISESAVLKDAIKVLKLVKELDQ